ncbi:MAG TPA: hypothetical protein PK855_03555 [Bacteroidales bacterium]|nr:hypothetical protein [Bacteroidales bacterium]
MNLVEQFNSYRAKMNEKMLAAPNNKIIKRIFSIDTLTYEDGALDAKTKRCWVLWPRWF